ncbi:MAG: hypothetical protein KC589_00710 [Nanoarchaeota archaeon]|nr:hypothetical protein [Nanoarchaeota archaeon]
MELLLFPYKGNSNLSLLKDFSSYGKNLNILKQLKQNNMKIEIKISVYYNEANEATLDAEVKTQEADIYEVFQTLEEVKKRYYEDYKRKKEAENILELLN